MGSGGRVGEGGSWRTGTQDRGRREGVDSP